MVTRAELRDPIETQGQQLRAEMAAMESRLRAEIAVTRVIPLAGLMVALNRP